MKTVKKLADELIKVGHIKQGIDWYKLASHVQNLIIDARIDQLKKSIRTDKRYRRLYGMSRISIDSFEITLAKLRVIRRKKNEIRIRTKINE